MNLRALGEAPVNPALEKLFERGIDPGSADEARRHDRGDWPDRATVAAFAAACDERVTAALATAKLEDASVPRLARGQAAYTILEHEPMHQETLLYIVHQLAYDRKRRVPARHEDHAVTNGAVRSIAAGKATLGADLDEIAFGWDNEFKRTEVDVPSF